MHPAVISTLSHFAFVKFRIRGLYESGALLWQGNDVQNSNLFLCLCMCVGGWGGAVLTCIEVEPYESEGQSYELCRSERNPADNN